MGLRKYYWNILTSFICSFSQRKVRIFGTLYTENICIYKSSSVCFLHSQSHKWSNCSQTVKVMSLASMKSSHHFCCYNNLPLSVGNVTKTLNYHHLKITLKWWLYMQLFCNFFLQKITILARKLLKMNQLYYILIAMQLAISHKQSIFLTMLVFFFLFPLLFSI